jgi:hypothetical protein
MLRLLYDFLPVFRIHIRIRTKISRIPSTGSYISANKNSDPDHNLTIKLECVDFFIFFFILALYT